MKRTSPLFLIFFTLLFLKTETIFAKELYPPHRFFYEGDQKLKLQPTSVYRQPLSPRLFALLDFLEDFFKLQSPIAIVSGYRSPEYNHSLRNKGKMAAKASLHMEGMAADVIFQGQNPQKTWETIRKLTCCGVGYYHGKTLHIDVGPARFWDETSSKVNTDISADNKQIYITTDYDIYYPEESIHFRPVRITTYPFGISPEFNILKSGGKMIEKGKLNFKECKIIQNRNDIQEWQISLNNKLPQNQKLKLQIFFCNKPSETMPDSTTSNSFIIAPEK